MSLLQAAASVPVAEKRADNTAHVAAEIIAADDNFVTMRVPTASLMPQALERTYVDKKGVTQKTYAFTFEASGVVDGIAINLRTVKSFPAHKCVVSITKA